MRPAEALRMALHRLRFGEDGSLLRDRVSNKLLKPPKPGQEKVDETPKTREEAEARNKSADDKERLVGLIFGPWAAAIGIICTNATISAYPKETASYHEVLVLLLVLALAMVGFGWFRKRLYLGMVTAMYGLTVFNLHYWGFGVPYLAAGSWLLVRAYRANRALKDWDGESPGPTSGGTGTYRAPRPSGRYTPPRSSRSRSRS